MDWGKSERAWVRILSLLAEIKTREIKNNIGMLTTAQRTQDTGIIRCACQTLSWCLQIQSCSSRLLIQHRLSVNGSRGKLKSWILKESEMKQNCSVKCAGYLSNFQVMISSYPHVSTKWQIFMKLGMDIILLQAIPLLCFQYPTINNTSTANVKTSDMGVTTVP
jgi:hypothetical protein